MVSMILTLGVVVLALILASFVLVAIGRRLGWFDVDTLVKRDLAREARRTPVVEVEDLTTSRTDSGDKSILAGGPFQSGLGGALRPNIRNTGAMALAA